MRVLLALAKVTGGLDKKATTILSDMTPASSGDTGTDMPRPILDCGPYANTVRQGHLSGSRQARAAVLLGGGGGRLGGQHVRGQPDLPASSWSCLRAAARGVLPLPPVPLARIRRVSLTAIACLCSAT